MSLIYPKLTLTNDRYGKYISFYDLCHKEEATYMYNPLAHRYSAPEAPISFKFDGHYLSSDYYSDIWSIGLIICKLITNTFPFDFQSVKYIYSEEYLNKSLDKKIIQNLPQPFQEIVRRCLKFHPKDRAQSVDELIVIYENHRNIKPNFQVKHYKTVPKFYSINFHKALGGGAQGQVYKGFDSQRNCEAAFKRSNYRQEKYSLTREAKIARRLRHPNIIEYFDAFISDTIAGTFEFAVMEYIEGLNLSEFLRKYNTLSDNVKIYILKGILNGLKYLHDNQIIHRDLKPSNILIPINGTDIDTPKITDFGISKDLLATQGRIPTKGIGSLPFMSPEQQDFLREQVGYYSDIWSFGIIAYYIETREYPVENITTSLVTPRTFSKNYKKSKIKRMKEPYRTIVEKCLKYHPKDRVKSVQELIDILANY